MSVSVCVCLFLQKDSDFYFTVPNALTVNREVDVLVYHVGASRKEVVRHLFSATSANNAINYTSLKTRFFGLDFCGRQCRCIFNQFNIIGPESYRIRRKNATQRPLRLSGLFKVTDFDTN